jgi:hypothetical protein
VKIAHYTQKPTHSVGVIKGIVRGCVSMWEIRVMLTIRRNDINK